MRQTPLQLSEADRSRIEELRSKGVHRSREVNRAHVLWCLDRQVPEAQILAVLGLARSALWRIRAAYLRGGVELAVFDRARPGRPRQYGSDVEAHVTALACSTPPAGRQRWTTGELQRVARQEPGLTRLGRETVRRMLKKTASSPGAG
jgi:putative transposase